ncbi:MAG: PaaI family thioesterase [Ilumatobacter sp.]|nr:MAG: PaaI family thioesterase [Ilumatobacter sp.]
MDAEHPEHHHGDHEHDHLDPLAHVAQAEHPDAVADARAEAGRAVRDLGHALVGHAAPIELIDRVTSTLDALSAELEAHTTRQRAQERQSGDWGPPPADGETMTSYEERPVSGRSSPWGLDLHIVRDGSEAVARLTLRAAHEGAPGRSHGGIVAALFDDVYGFVLTIHSQAAFTGELGIRYEAGTPIGRPLECRVRQTRRDGRKLYMTGELTDTTNDTVVARSTATFIAIDPSRFAAGADA